MEKHEIDALLVSKPENIYYMSGFTGGSDARLLISFDQNYILTDTRYSEQAARECPEWRLVEEKPLEIKELVELSGDFARIGVEGHYLSYQFCQELQGSLKSKVLFLANIVEELRLIKDEFEIQLLKEAARINDEVFADMCRKIGTGISERRLANDIVYLLKEKGCKKESFDVIAVSAENAALPHGQPGERCLQKGDMLTLDYGGFYQGYASDMTRTVAVAETSQQFRDRYKAVLEAQELGISLVKAGAVCRDIDRSIRECLKKYGLDIYFIHGTGHGLGLEIHEQPSVSSRSEAVLMENMVITIEPGIYIPRWGGIRIEDTVIVKNGGCEVISCSPKNLLII